MNKKAQGGDGIVLFFVVVVGIILLAPIVLKITGAVITPFGDSVAAVSPTANQTGVYIRDKFTNMWDYVIVFAFAANVLILLVTSFMVDIHPAFLVIYIIAAVFTLLFAPTVYSTLDAIYSPTGQFATEAGQLPITSFIYDYFGVVLLAVIALSAIILYAKFKYGRR